MPPTGASRSPVRIRSPLLTASLIVAAFATLAFAFRASLGWLWDVWTSRPEYSHGPMLPLIAGYLLWQRRALLRISAGGSRVAIAFLVTATLLYVLGVLGAVYTLQQYAFVLGLVGLILSVTGTGAWRAFAVPFLLLALMVPPPNVILNNLSAELQLISSALGVALIRAAGISVFLEGNVIDLGGYRLQVVEACDGMRYLFPLMTLGLVIAYFYRGAAWKRAAVFAASVPITVFMNSLRVGVIGIMVEHWGARMADGFLHDFQGWMVFMLSAALLVGVAVALDRVGGRRASWREAFASPGVAGASPESTAARLPASFFGASAFIVLIAALSLALPSRRDVATMRESFVSFPAQFGPLRGTRHALGSDMLAALALDDYVLADYADGTGGATNLYVSYYASQRDRHVVHSPRACIPGGGWQIASMTTVALPNGAGSTNRLLITNGDARELVYFWFDQRGRTLTNEWSVKWFLFWDALLLQRTDGAMVRLITPIAPTETLAAAERRLAALAAEVAPVLPRFVPK